jgi:hypothetical protein
MNTPARIQKVRNCRHPLRAAFAGQLQPQDPAYKRRDSVVTISTGAAE